MQRYIKTSVAVELLLAIFFTNNLCFAENAPKGADVFSGTDVAKAPDLPRESEESLGNLVSALRPHIEFIGTPQRDVFKNYIEEQTMEETMAEVSASQSPGLITTTASSDAILEEIEPPVKLPSLTVQGMVWDSSVPQAIVNNKIFKIGDVIQGAKITTIDESGVSLVFRKKTFKVKSSSFPKSVNPGNN